MKVGWEIRPIGWFVLAVVVSVIIYYTIKWLRRPPQKQINKQA
jgi:hypothetical protein